MLSENIVITGSQNDCLEARIWSALQAINNSGLNVRQQPNYSLRCAAEDFKISYSTLRDRWKGGRARKQAVEVNMALSLAQEHALANWTKAMGYRGMGWSPDMIMSAATTISGRLVTPKWFRGFCKRHPDVKLMRTRALESCRAQSLNFTQVMRFYDILEEVLVRLDIKEDRIYNMDEKGVQLGIGGQKGVLVDAKQKTTYHIENGNREMVTCLECVCADRTAVQSMHIFKAQNHNLEWGRNNPYCARYVSLKFILFSEY